jgi:hypothetical protein
MRKVSALTWTVLPSMDIMAACGTEGLVVDLRAPSPEPRRQQHRHRLLGNQTMTVRALVGVSLFELGQNPMTTGELAIGHSDQAGGKVVVDQSSASSLTGHGVGKASIAMAPTDPHHRPGLAATCQPPSRARSERGAGQPGGPDRVVTELLDAELFGGLAAGDGQ